MRKTSSRVFIGVLLLAVLGIFGWISWSQTRAKTTPWSVGQVLDLAEAGSVSLNRLDLHQQAQPVRALRLLVIGHLYGRPHDDAPHPAESVLRNIPFLQQGQPDAIMLLGDTVRHATRDNFDHLQAAFLDQFNVPVFNAVGNHDVENRELYQERFGATYYSLHAGPAYLIVLDTELDACQITGAQSDFLARALQAGLQNPDVAVLLVFMHKVMFRSLLSAEDPFSLPNDPRACRRSNFAALSATLFAPAAAQKPVYIFAGDVGALGGNLTPFYQLDETSGAVLIATGLGDSPADSLLQVDVNAAGTEIRIVPLGAHEFMPLAEYNLGYWEQLHR